MPERWIHCPPRPLTITHVALAPQSALVLHVVPQ